MSASKPRRADQLPALLLAPVLLLALPCRALPPSGLPAADLAVDRDFVNWPLQVSLASRLAAAPGLAVALQCDWGLWRHGSLDLAGGRPLLCLSQDCGALREQQAVLQPHRPGWAFHCLHAAQDFAETDEQDGAPPPKAARKGGRRGGAAAPTCGGGARARPSADVPGRRNGAGAAPAAGGAPRPFGPRSDPDGRRQALSGLSNREVRALLSNATTLVVGLPAGGAKLQPPAMAAAARAMPALQRVAVVVAAERGRQVSQLAVLEAPLGRVKVLYNPGNRYYRAGDEGIYHAAFWEAEAAKAARGAAARGAAGGAGASGAGGGPGGAYGASTAALRRSVGEALAKLGVRKVVHAYCGVKSWLPPLFARLAADHAAREALADLQAAGGGGGLDAESGGSGAAAAAESASLGAARRAARRAAAAAGGGGGGANSSGGSVNSGGGGFHYFGIDTACDQIQEHRISLAAGDHRRRPPGRPRARPAAPPRPPGARSATWRFECADAAHEGLPRGADLVATHDTLERLPLESAFMFLSEVRRSGAKYLLIGGFAGGGAPNREPRPGASGYYALDTTLPPFRLRPDPIATFEEDPSPPGPRRPPPAHGNGGGGGGAAASAPGGGIRGASAAEAAEEWRAGRHVVQLYEVDGLSWDDGLFDLFNYTRPAAPAAAGR